MDEFKYLVFNDRSFDVEEHEGDREGGVFVAVGLPYFGYDTKPCALMPGDLPIRLTELVGHPKGIKCHYVGLQL